MPVYVVTILIYFILPNLSSAKPARSPGNKTSLCYDANDAHHQRLWVDRAPGAMGDDPCTDIPFLRIFMNSWSTQRTDVGIIVIPGGGYDQLTNTKEQEPVAKYFADKLGE